MCSHRFHGRVKFMFGLIVILYPLLVFCALVVFKLPIKYLSVCIVAFAIIYIVLNRKHNKGGKNRAVLFISPVILCAIGSVSLLTDDALILKLYPALADLAYFTIWVTSFFLPPPLAYYFIEIFDKSIKDKIPHKPFEMYCHRATIVWCVFFVIDGCIAAATALWNGDLILGWKKDTVWGVYNAGISYIMMGLIFAGEFILLKVIQKKHFSKSVEPEETDVNR